MYTDSNVKETLRIIYVTNVKETLCILEMQLNWWLTSTGSRKQRFLVYMYIVSFLSLKEDMYLII